MAFLQLPLQYAMDKIFCMLEFDQFLIRKNLLQCFQNDDILPFPSHGISARKPKVLKEEVVEVYCQCKLL